MKKYISTKSTDKPIYELEIVAIMDITADVNSSNDILKHGQHMPYEYQLFDKEFEIYKDFIRTAISIIKKRDFAVIEEYQSNISYSYYIDFIPKTYEDTDYKLRVKFRLSNHVAPEVSRDIEDHRSSSDHIFKSFIVNDVTCDSVKSTLKEIADICNHLQLGDFDILF